MSSTPTSGMPGLLLAELSGVVYVQVTGVFAVRGDDIAYYTDPANWPDSPAAKEFARRTKIAQLEAELAQLRAVEPPQLPRPGRQLPKARVKAATAVAVGPTPCPTCGQLCKGRNGLALHVRLKHTAPPAATAEADGPKAGARS